MSAPATPVRPRHPSPPTPRYEVDEAALRRNLALAADIQSRGPCRMLLALKGFAMFSLFPLMSKTLAGAAASSLNEARLAKNEFPGETHLFAPAYAPDEFPQALELADHIVFNSAAQWRKFRSQAAGRASCGIRVNPLQSEVQTPLYNPATPQSRFGVVREHFPDDPEFLRGLDGLHFHALCDSPAESLRRIADRVRRDFADILPRMKWINLGGGHALARDNYDREQLIAVARQFADMNLQVYLEPAEGLLANCGKLVAAVMDVLPNNAVVLNASATAHMPDVLEAPYRPEVENAADPGALSCDYVLGGNTCLAGDVFGAYSFAKPLREGDEIVLRDAASYTMVKNTAFNGVQLPAICIRRESGELDVVREFGHEDYRGRLS